MRVVLGIIIGGTEFPVPCASSVKPREFAYFTCLHHGTTWQQGSITLACLTVWPAVEVRQAGSCFASYAHNQTHNYFILFFVSPQEWQEIEATVQGCFRILTPERTDTVRGL